MREEADPRDWVGVFSIESQDWIFSPSNRMRLVFALGKGFQYCDVGVCWWEVVWATLWFWSDFAGWVSTMIPRETLWFGWHHLCITSFVCVCFHMMFLLFGQLERVCCFRRLCILFTRHVVLWHFSVEVRVGCAAPSSVLFFSVLMW